MRAMAQSGCSVFKKLDAPETVAMMHVAGLSINQTVKIGRYLRFYNNKKPLFAAVRGYQNRVKVQLARRGSASATEVVLAKKRAWDATSKKFSPEKIAQRTDKRNQHENEKKAKINHVIQAIDNI